MAAALGASAQLVARPVFVRPPAVCQAAGASQRVELTWRVPLLAARGSRPSWLLYARGLSQVLQLVTPYALSVQECHEAGELYALLTYRVDITADAPGVLQFVLLRKPSDDPACCEVLKCGAPDSFAVLSLIGAEQMAPLLVLPSAAAVQEMRRLFRVMVAQTEQLQRAEAATAAAMAAAGIAAALSPTGASRRAAGTCCSPDTPDRVIGWPDTPCTAADAGAAVDGPPGAPRRAVHRALFSPLRSPGHWLKGLLSPVGAHGLLATPRHSSPILAPLEPSRLAPRTGGGGDSLVFWRNSIASQAWATHFRPLLEDLQLLVNGTHTWLQASACGTSAASLVAQAAQALSCAWEHPVASGTVAVSAAALLAAGTAVAGPPAAQAALQLPSLDDSAGGSPGQGTAFSQPQAGEALPVVTDLLGSLLQFFAANGMWCCISYLLATSVRSGLVDAGVTAAALIEGADDDSDEASWSDQQLSPSGPTEAAALASLWPEPAEEPAPAKPPPPPRARHAADACVSLGGGMVVAVLLLCCLQLVLRSIGLLPLPLLAGGGQACGMVAPLAAAAMAALVACMAACKRGWWAGKRT